VFWVLPEARYNSPPLARIRQRTAQKRAGFVVAQLLDLLSSGSKSSPRHRNSNERYLLVVALARRSCRRHPVHRIRWVSARILSPPMVSRGELVVLIDAGAITVDVRRGHPRRDLPRTAPFKPPGTLAEPKAPYHLLLAFLASERSYTPSAAPLLQSAAACRIPGVSYRQSPLIRSDPWPLAAMRRWFDRLSASPAQPQPGCRRHTLRAAPVRRSSPSTAPTPARAAVSGSGCSLRPTPVIYRAGGVFQKL
jgi:hypothetical protein